MVNTTNIFAESLAQQNSKFLTNNGELDDRNALKSRQKSEYFVYHQEEYNTYKKYINDMTELFSFEA